MRSITSPFIPKDVARADAEQGDCASRCLSYAGLFHAGKCRTTADHHDSTAAKKTSAGGDAVVRRDPGHRQTIRRVIVLLAALMLVVSFRGNWKTRDHDDGAGRPRRSAMPGSWDVRVE